VTEAVEITDNRSRLFEIARVLVRFDYVARFIINTNHSIVRPAEKLDIADRIADRIRFAIPQAIC
jgi:hypothetical protein